jgi:hypothetical protein
LHNVKNGNIIAFVDLLIKPVRKPMNLSDTLKNIANQGAVAAGANLSKYPDDPQMALVESLAFKLGLLAQDPTILAEITDEEIDALRIEVKLTKEAKTWIMEIKNNDTF